MKNKETKLTIRQQRFIDAFKGNATDAARVAGYANPDVAGCKLLRIPKVLLMIQDREKIDSEMRIADREERQIFWTSLMREGNEKTPDRVRASELLGKSQADFIDRSEVRMAEVKPEPKRDFSRLTFRELFILRKLLWKTQVEGCEYLAGIGTAERKKVDEMTDDELNRSLLVDNCEGLKALELDERFIEMDDDGLHKEFLKEIKDMVDED